MTWTCEQTEARLSDYLDGILETAELHAFNQHVNTCERCAPLVAGVAHVLGDLYGLEQVEPPRQLESAILTATLGKRRVWDVRGWLRTLQSPRFVYSFASVAATIIMIMSACLFRVVYELQSRINENDQNPSMREETIPQTAPKKEPGQTDNTDPSKPKQQNRANQLGRNLEMLACELPVLTGLPVERRMP